MRTVRISMRGECAERNNLPLSSPGLGILARCLRARCAATAHPIPDDSNGGRPGALANEKTEVGASRRDDARLGEATDTRERKSILRIGEHARRYGGAPKDGFGHDCELPQQVRDAEQRLGPQHVAGIPPRRAVRAFAVRAVAEGDQESTAPAI
jgi:hypothetical protein